MSFDSILENFRDQIYKIQNKFKSDLSFMNPLGINSEFLSTIVINKSNGQTLGLLCDISKNEDGSFLISQKSISVDISNIYNILSSMQYLFSNLTRKKDGMMVLVKQPTLSDLDKYTDIIRNWLHINNNKIRDIRNQTNKKIKLSAKENNIHYNECKKIEAKIDEISGKLKLELSLMVNNKIKNITNQFINR